MFLTVHNWVAATDDMNGDGLGEVMIGAPGYAGVQLLDVRSGAAFVYYSNNLAGNTPTKLSAPSLLNFGSLINIDGLLFGFSVDGIGDYDKDGKPDVIVGAPGGLNLGLLGFLGGSAYIYKGTGAGVSTAIKTQLSPSGPIVGSVANLFGYKVKGVKNISGVRTGNVLVSAPVGNVLSNVLSGLRLKTGNVYLFQAKASPATSEVSTQSFSSPRSANLLAQLLTVNISVNALFGASIDNMLDANCDGIADIIVGEPLSTAVGLINVDAIGGTAYIFTGKPDGTYNTTPYWTLENKGNFDISVNAGSMIGLSVAGGGHTKGSLKSVRALVGAPGKALDFSTGLLNLGNTLGTLFSFTSANNGLGKIYAFALNCNVVIMPDVNATHINETVAGSVHTNDAVPTATTYGTPVEIAGNPTGAIINLNADGAYTFVTPVPGVYSYNVPVCVPDQSCTNALLTITVLDVTSALKPPIANTDIASTFTNQPVTVNTLANDAAGNIGGALFVSSVTIVANPLHGTAVINTLTGAITYTPSTGYTGMDTLRYNVCDNSEPAALCATALQIFTVAPFGAANTTLAADDFIHIAPNATAFGNVKINDTDPEGNTQTVASQTATIAGKGTLVLAADGTYSFTPVAGFTGSVSFVYSTCDDGTPSDCADATLYILVSAILNPDLTPSTRLANGTFIEAGSTTRDLAIEINEIQNITTDNATTPVQVRITKSDNFDYSFDPNANTAKVPGLITVNNIDWDIITNNSSVILFQLKPGKNVKGLTSSRLMVSMKVLAGAAIGTENQTVVIINASGGEVNFNNNSVVRILNTQN